MSSSATRQPSARNFFRDAEPDAARRACDQRGFFDVVGHCHPFPCAIEQVL
jgi:hypothetical protein